MAEQAQETGELSAGNLPALRMEKGRVSYNGLKVLSGQILEDCNMDLRWPHCMTTYKAMFKDATISSALTLMEMNISKVKWKVKIPEGHEEELKEKARFLESCMTDMEHTWTDFIRTAATAHRFGFAPIEKVYRKRTRANGSRFKDGLYGIKELPLIAQDSISAWEWGEDGRKITGLWQWKNIPKGKKKGTVYEHLVDDKFIRKEKFMLFRVDPLKDSPIGTSVLNNVYIAWRFKTEYEHQEGLGVASDVRGQKVFYMPPNYMSESASQEEKDTYKYFQQTLALMHSGEQSGVILPMAYDEGKKLFDFEVKSVLGSSTYDVSEIIARFRREIVTGLMYPSMIIGQDGSGSFALAESLEGISATVVESRLTTIRDILNQDLIPQLFALNGWDVDILPSFEFEDVSRSSLDEWSSAIQRIASNGLIKLDAKTINKIHSRLGLDTAYDDEDVSVEEIRENATNADSSAGEGMRSAIGVGTAKRPTSSDASTGNKEN